MFTSHRDWEVSVNVMNYTGPTLHYSADISVVSREADTRLQTRQ